MTTDMLNKKIQQIVTELFIRERKLDISLVFITQSHFTVRKNVRLNSMHFLLQKLQITRASTVQI